MWNPSVTLPQVAISPTWAKLARLDGKGLWEFMLNPEAVENQYTASFSELAVLGTSQPLVYYQNSRTTFNLPKVIWTTPGQTGDLTVYLEGIKALTRPVSPGQPPPLVRFDWGNKVVHQCYVSSLSIRETQRRSGRLVWAEGQMGFTIAPEVPKPLEEPPKVQLSQAERKTGAEKVRERVKADPQWARANQIGAKDTVAVAEDGTVEVTAPGGKPRPIGALKDIVKVKESLK